MIIEKKFCSKCGKKLTKPVRHFLKPNEIDIKVTCFDCFSKTESYIKKVNTAPFYSHDENLEKWK